MERTQHYHEGYERQSNEPNKGMAHKGSTIHLANTRVSNMECRLTVISHCSSESIRCIIRQVGAEAEDVCTSRTSPLERENVHQIKNISKSIWVKIINITESNFFGIIRQSSDLI